MTEHHKEIAILYHGSCPDGFGGAYAAWKKFGDGAEYIPVTYGRPVPENLTGKEVYFVDFCYPQVTMNEIAETAKSVTVLDHHEGVRDVAMSFPGVFDPSHSGATIAWSYFHPDTPVPTFLTYIEDGDLYLFKLPHAREILAYAYTSPLSFEGWDMLAHEIDDPAERERVIHTGILFNQYHEHIVQNAVNHAKLVQFAGYDCYLTGASPEFKSDVGHNLTSEEHPVGIVVSANATELRVSLRSNGTVDVATIAQKYGGNGHPTAAGFKILFGNPMPWTPIEEHENPGD